MQTTSQRIERVCQYIAAHGEIKQSGYHTKALRVQAHPTSGNDMIMGLMRRGLRGYRWLWIAEDGLADLERITGPAN